MGKFSLIDLDTPAGATGRKDGNIHRERLSERTRKRDATVWSPTITHVKEVGEGDPKRFPRQSTRLVSSGQIRGREVTRRKWYSGYETLAVEGSDVLTSSNFDWKQANANVTMSGLEELQNAGKQAVHNLVKSRIMVAEKTMQNNVAAALFYANTEHGGKAIGGLQHLIADLPTSGTVGGIDRSSNVWWRNQYYDFSGESVTASNSTITPAMNRTYLRCTRGTDSIDLVVAGETYFTYYEESLQAQQRFMSETKAAGGFNAYKYKNADVVYDSNCAATRMYMLNTDYLHFRPHENRNFVTLDRKSSVNQDATVVPIYWAGNLTCSNASLQGVIVA